MEFMAPSTVNKAVLGLPGAYFTLLYERCFFTNEEETDMSLRRWILALVILIMLCCLWSSARAQQPDQDKWWLTPHRLLQTNLREIDATMDTDQYVHEAKEFGANIVLFNVGGIVANYPTELEYHWRNKFMKGDLVGQTLTKLHKAGIKMIARFDFSKTNQKYAANHP